MKKKISVIIPAYNEEHYIEKTVVAIHQWSFPLEAIIVNDGSTDQTTQIINDLSGKFPIKAIYLEKNVGKGKALMKGIEQASGDIIIFLDADLGETAKHAVKLLSPILESKADMAIACLPAPKHKGGFGFVKGLAKAGIYYFTGQRISASLSGQRAMTRKVIEAIPTLTSGFGIEVGLTIDVLRRGFIIKEVEIPLTHRETGRDIEGVLHRGREFMDVLKALLFKWRELQ